MTEVRPWRITTVCCLIEEGEICPHIDKYREPEETDVKISPTTTVRMRMLDLKAWLASDDWLGYICYTSGEPPTDEQRAAVAEAVRHKYPTPRPMIFVTLPNVVIPDDWQAIAFEELTSAISSL